MGFLPCGHLIPRKTSTCGQPLSSCTTGPQVSRCLRQKNVSSLEILLTGKIRLDLLLIWSRFLVIPTVFRPSQMVCTLQVLLAGNQYGQLRVAARDSPPTPAHDRKPRVAVVPHPRGRLLVPCRSSSSSSTLPPVGVHRLRRGRPAGQFRPRPDARPRRRQGVAQRGPVALAIALPVAGYSPARPRPAVRGPRDVGGGPGRAAEGPDQDLQGGEARADQPYRHLEESVARLHTFGSALGPGARDHQDVRGTR